DLYNRQIVGIESAILVEAGFTSEVDFLVMVSAPEEVRIARAVRRDASSRELIEKRVRSQMNDEEKRSYADYVIVNDDETPLIPQLLELLSRLKAAS
ncbi:MAG: dephospho-CoA kinase, partial [Bacteroides sp.]|nr:dephospho-CoA kinase [Bacteroides sp.]